MHKIVATFVLGTMLAAAQTQSQPTAAELLQKGIYSEDAAGDLDGAIKIYRQIVDSHPAQREIGAQAQYRLGLALLAKGDTNGASQEIQRLGWDFPDYKELVAAAKSGNGQLRTPSIFIPTIGKPLAQQDLVKVVTQHDAEYDFTRSTTITGTIRQVQLVNPYSWLAVNPNGDTTRSVSISLDSPDALLRGGWERSMPHLGDQVTVTGAPARDGTPFIQATSVSLNGVVIFTRAVPLADEGKRFIVTGGGVYVNQVPNHDAEFDFSKLATVMGTVLQVQWINPYVWLTVDTASPGETSSRPYLIALDSPSSLMAHGLSRETVKAGSQVTITGAPARDSSVTMQATSVSANGAVLFARSAPVK
jgi:hypothetical protein